MKKYPFYTPYHGMGDSRFSILKGKLDNQGYTFRIRMQEEYKTEYKDDGTVVKSGDRWKGTVVGYIKSYLKVGDKEIRLGTITAEDVKNSNLEFTFEVVMAKYKTDAEDASIIGHEIFLHTQNRLKGLQELKKRIEAGEIDEDNYQKIADELNNIQAEAGLNGDNEHKEVSTEEPKAKNYLKYLKELKDAIPEDKKKWIDRNINIEKEYYEEL